MKVRMRNKVLSIIIMLFCGMIQGQILETFETLEKWSGEANKFEVVNDRLHLNAPSAGNAYLVTTSQISLEATWEFWLKLGFSPSNSNKIEIVVISDSEFINRDYKGYFISIGETGPDDAIAFYRKDGAIDNLLGRGIEGRVGVQLDSIHIKVTRDSDHNWIISSDVGTGYETEFSVIDDTYLESSYFGFYPIYTSTRSDLFYFDNVSISGKVFIDDLVPVVLSSELILENKIQIDFNELLDSTKLEVSNFELNGVNPESMSLRGTTVELVFKELVSDTELILEGKGIRDLAGNTTSLELKFQYHKYTSSDLVISELLFNPVIGGSDYIEIYNTTSVALDSDDLLFVSFDLETGDTVQSKGLDTSLVIEANTYCVFTEDKEHLLQNYVIENPNYVIELDIPSMNDDEGIVGLFRNGLLLDNVHYSKDFHAPFLSDEEGVSLERINLSVSGEVESNWYSASESSNWGTPTERNSAIRQTGFSNYELDTDRISPDGDGYQDFALLSYSNVELGTLVSVFIYDRNGIRVNSLYQNYSIVGSGRLKIDAVKSSGILLPPDIYVLLIESFNSNGETESIKRILTVNARF